MKHWTTIDGRLSEAEGYQLAALATGRAVLEIGPYLGRSTVAMASTARAVLAVDWHQGHPPGRAIPRYSTLTPFLRNLAEAGAANVVPVVARSEEVGPLLADSSFGLVFIDGCHEYPSVLHDTRLALRVLARPGVIAWHDWEKPAVREAVAACDLEPAHFLDRLAWLFL